MLMTGLASLVEIHKEVNFIWKENTDEKRTCLVGASVVN